jgi:hypothetical protein
MLSHTLEQAHTVAGWAGSNVVEGHPPDRCRRMPGDVVSAAEQSVPTASARGLVPPTRDAARPLFQHCPALRGKDIR